MGDWFQTIADVEVTSADAEALAGRVREWLVSSEVVSGGLTDCVLGSGRGYPPGPRVGEVVDAGGGSSSWLDLWANGLDIVTEPRAFDAGQGEPSAVTCPHCATEIRLVDAYYTLIDEAWEPFRGLIGAWHDGEDGIMPCPVCARPVEPAAWRWEDDHFAFGRLGFTFWNWPPLRPEFVAELTRRLGGHRTVLLEGKL